MQSSINFVKRGLGSAAKYSFEHISIQRPSSFVVQVSLNRPEKRNALNYKLWSEIGQCFEDLSSDSECRAVVLTGAGKGFCAGIDFSLFMEVGQQTGVDDSDVARKFTQLYKSVRYFQRQFAALEKCQKPIICAVNGVCVGGGMSLIAGADIRYATDDAMFSIREVAMGLSADVGYLQRIGRLVGNDSLTRELAFTARNFSAKEALDYGIVSRIFPTKETMMDAAISLASDIAQKSPVAVQGTKIQLNYARDHSVADSLAYHATWNGVMLQSEDVVKAATAQITRAEEPPDFAKL
jgi:delta(3,5)-delta(2,4)-dienoyl-CoA isomerase